MLKLDLGGYFSEHFSRHLKFYLLFAALAILGLVLGIISANNISGFLTEDKIKLIFFKNIYINVNFFIAFFGNTFIMLILFGVIILVNISVFLLPLGFVLIIYRGYLAGFSAVALIKIYGGGGIVNLIIIFLPFQLMLMFFLIGAMAVCMRRLINNFHFGAFCLFGVEYKIMFKELINLFIVFVIVNFLLSLICMIITKAFIISF
ncbi:MAG: hypothetical protein GX756_03195 [Clostridiales bacterium]|jgi:hypothetical protein|nr:hypothetical protein [Clostridiales bacterium]